ncbi:MAG: hypothetical protein DRJ38_01010 [Thermoprotei archaeon]|nr:MAG: hypothetical protein DRJ38_01010 [Thermoprotei archaeon]
MNQLWKKPPRIKVLEALGCIADRRIELISDYEAKVVSSTGERTYIVKWNGGKAIFSNDNGSIYRGYLGYPSIAFLMLKGLLPFNKRIAEGLKGIPWKRLNEKYKKYWIVESIIKRQLKRRGISEEEVENFIKEVLTAIKKLKPEKLEV